MKRFFGYEEYYNKHITFSFPKLLLLRFRFFKGMIYLFYNLISHIRAMDQLCLPDDANNYSFFPLAHSSFSLLMDSRPFAAKNDV